MIFGSKASAEFGEGDFLGVARQGRALFAADERLGDLRRGEHEVHRARRDGASGHAVIVGFAELLRDDEAAFRLYRR